MNPTVERFLFSLPAVLSRAAAGPCACGRRSHADRLRALDEPRTAEEARFGADLLPPDGYSRFRTSCTLQCEVCDHMQNFAMIQTVHRELLEAGDEPRALRDGGATNETASL